MNTSDIRDDNDIPALAELLYHGYNFDALDFAIDATLQASDFLTELYPGTTPEQKSRMIQILRLEALMRFCHFAENLGAISLAFKADYADEKEEKKGIFKSITTYNIGQIVDFYANISKRDLDYIAHFVGYPDLSVQVKDTRAILEACCKNIKRDMSEIALLYLEYRILYDAYKHGYRVFFGKNKQMSNGYAYVDTDLKQKTTVVDDATFVKVRKRANSCRKIIETIINQHNNRATFEKGNGKPQPGSMALYVLSGDPRPTGTQRVTYPSRKERISEGEKLANEVYEKHRAELEAQHKGKIVILDVDADKIVGVNYDMDKVLEILNASGSSGRLLFRRVGKNNGMGIRVY